MKVLKKVSTDTILHHNTFIIIITYMHQTFTMMWYITIAMGNHTEGDVVHYPDGLPLMMAISTLSQKSKINQKQKSKLKSTCIHSK